MQIEQTLSIIKPNVIIKNSIGSIISRLEKAGLFIVASKMIKLNWEKAVSFYIEHKNKSFFEDLIHFISSSPIIVQVLEGYNAVQRNREIMGNTNPKLALSGTLRSDYSDSIVENSIHGSDSIISAKKEINFFFKTKEIFSRI
ncbi:nucleoside diphosphate kinase/apyrimidinic endonuclease/3'-phosphodiesterase [Wigglesworthia glossinidia endosymbiont of Glossina morsitans morsitans (Yale colony)]|uniref:Nucleoside diphosphate kinase n=1 Tax=Wigglesworthia glossinidia endosymbiont of Glossina morsitans morsitans (Yale colony) TaxID=1142511 RepID=H6Q4G6_WIGGL|nr:nucleoside-diphosphate kinase [Wigglesworthia glossinidia]AFA41026.1 nucleoside diphosphate kinase/apyrimidinic endonuclease/3'-phosphodiesterase [Wigglesworthia glossinidia endosymbiont of Glossina morsitans morsitans (Yale colony)]